MSSSNMGTCAACKLKHPINDLAAHVAACERRLKGDADSLQIVVGSPEFPEFWMSVEAQSQATLEALDRFLRKAWLECCGHLSAFTIGKQRYESYLGDFEYGEKRPLGMKRKLAELVKPRSKFSYEYDFGSTTELVLQVVGRLQCKPSRKAIQLLALNDPPQRICEETEECENSATGLCAYCSAMPICADCLRTHDCGEEAICPIVNSPRAGVCGYEGPTIKV